MLFLMIFDNRDREGLVTLSAAKGLAGRAGTEILRCAQDDKIDHTWQSKFRE
jgi:hypothetical protein